MQVGLLNVLAQVPLLIGNPGGDSYYRRPYSDDKKYWEHAKNQWKDELRAHFRSLLLGSLHALVAKLFGIHAQGVTDTGAELHGLHE